MRQNVVTLFASRFIIKFTDTYTWKVGDTQSMTELHIERGTWSITVKYMNDEPLEDFSWYEAKGL